MVLTDTGYWLALANPRDRHHQLSIDISKKLDSELVITWPVITEVCHLLGNRVNKLAPLKFLKLVESSTAIFEIQPSHFPRIQILMDKYNNLPMDLADVSLVIAAEELGHGSILSTDRRDFNTYRWKNHKPFNNLLFPND